MSKVAQAIVLILFLLLGSSVFMVLQTLNQKQTLEKSKSSLENQLDQAQVRETKLIQDSKKLQEDLKLAQEDKTRLESQVTELNAKISDFNTKIAAVTAERDDWKSRVDTIRSESDELMAKLTAKASEQQAAAVTAPPKKEQPQEQAPVLEIVEKPQEKTAAPLEPQALPPLVVDDRYWADVLKEKAELTIQIEKYKTDLDARSLEVENLKKESSDLNTELAKLKDEKEEIERKIKSGDQLADNLAMELTRVRRDRRYDVEKAEKLQKENVALRTEIKNLTNTKIALERSIARITEDKKISEKKLEASEGLIQGRIDEVWQIEDSLDKNFQTVKSQESQAIELPPIIVSAPGPALQQLEENPGFSGKIVSVNEDNNFVIVDLGENNGIQLGETLNVYRGAQNIAKLEVIQVRKDISAADIKQKTSRLQVGDTVK